MSEAGNVKVRRLTKRQAACLAPAANVMVRAGAGSGKTFLLVRKMADLLSGRDGAEDPAGVQNVLAVTFTRKAAGEMRARLYRELLDRIERSDSTALRDHLIMVKEGFHAAHISTIHGFASSLIRNRPVTLGVDPDFEISDPAQEAALKDDVIRSTLARLWDEQDPALGRVLEFKEPYQLRKLLIELLGNRTELDALLDAYVRTDTLEELERIQRAWWTEFLSGPEGVDLILRDLDGYEEHCRDVLDRSGKRKTDENNRVKARRSIDEFIEPFRQLVSSSTVPEGLSARLREFREIAVEIGEFRKKGSKTPRGMVTAAEKLMVPRFDGLERDSVAIDWIRDLLAVAVEARDLYERELAARALLSHEDLILKARDLCRQSAQEARGALDFFLVDEFQDTDPAQWEIVRRLAEAGRPPVRNVFLVGDTKQAIYGFRGADHTVTGAALEELRASAGVSEHILDENFRSLSAPLCFSNELFSSLFGSLPDPSNPYAVPAQPLAAMREELDPTPRSSTVKFLVTEIEDDDPWTTEARAVASFLRTIRDGGAPEYAEITDLMAEGLPAAAILFRTYSPMPAYVGELFRAGLPFSIYHGRTFFDTPEIHTLTDLLAWLADPEDDPALLGVLRSPLFSWTDEDLASAAGFADIRRKPLWERIQRAAHASETGGADRSKPIRAVAALSRLRALSAHLSISETLRAALDGSMAPLLLGLGARGAQAGANVEKFLSLIREVESSESASLHTALDALRLRSAAGPGEAEADHPADERGGIQLMSIHAAKGLEFPMVITACAGKGVQRGLRSFFKRITIPDSGTEGGVRRLTLAAIDHPGPDRDADPKPTFMKALLKKHSDMQTEAEEKRLLYVALTRAENHILIPLSTDGESIVAESGAHASLLLEGIPDLQSAVVSGALTVGVGAMEAEILRFPGDTDEDAGSPELDVEAERARAVRVDLPRPAPPPASRDLPYPRRIPLSVTEAMLFSRCPRRFYFEKYYLGASALDRPPLPEDAARDKTRIDREGESPEDAATVGSAVHRALERHEALVAEWDGEGAMPDTLNKEMTTFTARRSRGEAHANTLRSKVETHLRNLAAGGVLAPWIADGPQEGSVTMREVPFEVEEGDFIVRGVIDRLERLPDGSWRLWDYKTSDVRSHDKADIVAEEAYDVQIAFYVWAARRIVGDEDIECAVIFTGARSDQVFRISACPEDRTKQARETLDALSEALDGGIEAFRQIKGGKLCRACPCPDVSLC